MHSTTTAALPAHLSVRIELGDRSYPIVIASGVLADAQTWAQCPKAQHAFIVTNTTVGPLFAAQLAGALQSRYPQVHTLELPDGEAHKNWLTLNQVFDALLQHGCERSTVVFALGGGVVGDLAGFAAACYMRGVPFVQVPTTLLAQVDSSVGGKTAINHPLGKNMIGAFYQPHRVVCDLATLGSLPQREFAAGLAEVIKYGPIADMQFFGWLEANMDALLAREPVALTHAVRRSVEIKARIVAADEREGGLRAVLNFGHTFGHAIETALGYGQWLHGEAVAVGMCMAASLSARLGLLGDNVVQRLVSLIERAGLPTRVPALDAHDNLGTWMRLMQLDKKAHAGDIRFVLLNGPGQAIVRTAPAELVGAAIAAYTLGVNA